MVNVSFCRLGKMIPAPFEAYVLPTTRSALAQAEPDAPYTIIGAMWNGLACAVAVAAWNEAVGVGEILSLFVDPKARHCGVAGHLVDLIAEEGTRRGAQALTCEYILKGDELAAMDALFQRRGAELENGSPVCGMNSDDFLSSPLLGPALHPGWKREANVALFSELTQAQLESLERAEGLPTFLRPSALGDRVDPVLSAAWLTDGMPTAFVSGFQSGERMFCQSSVWRGANAPEGSFRALICTQVNQCWYRIGGSFVFYISPINPRSAAMAQWFTGGNYESYGQHSAAMLLPGAR
jgi:GNAT superfamily N-acetyltransferase